MAGPALRHLCPPLFRPSISTAIAETCVKPRVPRAGFRTLTFHNTPATEASQRYGTANEPPPHLLGQRLVDPKERPDQRALPRPEQPEAKAAAKPDQAQADKGVFPAQRSQFKPKGKDDPIQQQKAPDGETDKDRVEASTTANALSQILRMEPPMSEDAEEKPPHLQAPPYVHHFDTYTLVKSLHEDGGFTQEQAVTIMKAVRLLLADNMQLARDGIVGKGDAEMAAYLFRAACNELRTEMKNNRSSMTERMRGERTSLQHEVDILAQRITADTGILKDDLKGMFDDRKMTVRMERRDIENRIQELNYKITTRLNSECRGEVEGLRWVLVRRAVGALVIVAATALVVLRINSSAQKRAEGEGGPGRKRVEMPGHDGAMSDANAVSSSTSSDLMKGLEGGGDPSLVSLG